MKLRLWAAVALLLHVCAATEQMVLSDDPSLPSLDTVLTLERDVSFFASYLRDQPFYTRIINVGSLFNTTIFAPRDKAILNLHRKPHQGPVDDPDKDMSISDEKGNAKYLERWTASHLVAGSVDLESGEADSLADDRVIRFEVDEEGKTGWEHTIVQPGGARIVSMSVASDGVLYVLDEVLTF